MSRCKAIYAYSPKLDDELEINPGNNRKHKISLRKTIYSILIYYTGDLIDVHTKQEDGWWIGAIKDRVGIFPATYVEEIA